MSALEKEVTIPNDLGLHMRAAGVLVRVAGRFESSITLVKGAMTADAKSIMSVLSLAAAKGTTLRLRAEGADSQQALDAVAATIEQGFEEMS